MANKQTTNPRQKALDELARITQEELGGYEVTDNPLDRSQTTDGNTADGPFIHVTTVEGISVNDQTKRDQTTDRYAGFSSNELLRRARILREIAQQERKPRDRRHLEELALEHEDEARAVRIRAAQELGIA